MLQNCFSDPKNDIFRQDMAIIWLLWPFICNKVTKFFYHGYQHPIWPKTDKNWVYFGPFRPKIDQKMVSYKITFTKKWYFMPIFHLYTQIRIILDHHVWDLFPLNRIWTNKSEYFEHLFLKRNQTEFWKTLFLLFGSLSGFSLP